MSSDSFERDRLLGWGKSQFEQVAFIQFPAREDPEVKRTPPLVRVRLCVDYRVHSRQMLCVGGSQIPFGWSFLSIAKVPMAWNTGDLWAVEVELPAGTRVEYKYVILEEQDWTQQVNELSEGRVEYTYRIEPEPSPPDVTRITRQMAIVAWQPGPNRILQVPTEEELAELRPGQKRERLPPRPAGGSQRRYGTQALGSQGRPGAAPGGPQADAPAPRPFPPPADGRAGARTEELSGVWEVLSVDDQGRPFLDRRDVWGREGGGAPARRVERSMDGHSSPDADYD